MHSPSPITLAIISNLVAIDVRSAITGQFLYSPFLNIQDIYIKVVFMHVPYIQVAHRDKPTTVHNKLKGSDDSSSKMIFSPTMAGYGRVPWPKR